MTLVYLFSKLEGTTLWCSKRYFLFSCFPTTSSCRLKFPCLMSLFKFKCLNLCVVHGPVHPPQNLAYAQHLVDFPLPSAPHPRLCPSSRSLLVSVVNSSVILHFLGFFWSPEVEGVHLLWNFLPFLCKCCDYPSLGPVYTRNWQCAIYHQVFSNNSQGCRTRLFSQIMGSLRKGPCFSPGIQHSVECLGTGHSTCGSRLDTCPASCFDSGLHPKVTCSEGLTSPFYPDFHRTVCTIITLLGVFFFNGTSLYSAICSLCIRFLLSCLLHSHKNTSSLRSGTVHLLPRQPWGPRAAVMDSKCGRKKCRCSVSASPTGEDHYDIDSSPIPGGQL